MHAHPEPDLTGNV